MKDKGFNFLYVVFILIVIAVSLLIDYKVDCVKAKIYANAINSEREAEGK